MRSAPTLNSWMMPFSSVAMIEKLALVRIAFCKAPVLSSVSWRRNSLIPSGLHSSFGTTVSYSRRIPSLSQQFGNRLQRFHMLGHHFHDDYDRNAEQHAPDAPEPSPEQQRHEHRG